MTGAAGQPASNEQVAATVAQAPTEVQSETVGAPGAEMAGAEADAPGVPGAQIAGAQAAAPDDQVAGVQIAAIPELVSTAGVGVASMLPATGQPVTLLGIGMLSLAGIGLFMRRIGRKSR